MIVKVFNDKKSLAQAAADEAGAVLRETVRDRGKARIIAATGNSQLEFLDALTRAKDIDWKKVEMFHLDEYVGLPATHPASFRKYLREHLIDKTGMTQYHFLEGDRRDLDKMIFDMAKALLAAPIDVAFVGIGENGHLAFNDPPADFETEEPYLIVKLDEACQRQQVGEGWFGDISQVPKEAISMSVRQILKARQIICVVPDARKATAVELCVEGEVSPNAPASILRRHPATTIYLDGESAARLSPKTLSAFAAAG
jgi:glucosamine-6-phosphate deaminase